MAFITVDAEITAIPRIVELLTFDKVRNLNGTHPLARGLRCYLGLLENPSIEEMCSMWELEHIARTVEKYLLGRVNERHLARHLRKAKDCRALAFEAQVISSMLEPYVERVDWRRYAEGTSDILTTNPTIQVECTLIGNYSLELMADRVTEHRKLRQRTVGEGPFLLTVGTRSSQDSHIFQDIDRAFIDQWGDWLKRHRDVSAIYFSAPRLTTVYDRLRNVDEEHAALRFQHSTGFCMRNLHATEPLPAGFEDNWRLQR